MNDLSLSVESNPAPRDVAVLEAGLGAHALPITHTPGFAPLAVFVRDAAGRVVGGISGRVNWNWLQVNLVWVYSRAELARLADDGFEVVLAPREEIIPRTPPQSGVWAQWETIWRRRHLR